MPKNEFSRGTLTFNLVDFGIFDITLDFTFSELDTTDTLTSVGESEFLGGKQVITFSFTMYKDAGAADLTLNRTTTHIPFADSRQEVPLSSTHIGWKNC